MNSVRKVFGVSDWPEGGEDFEIVTIRDGESDEDAIERARSHYHPKLECYIKEVVQ